MPPPTSFLVGDLVRFVPYGWQGHIDGRVEDIYDDGVLAVDTEAGLFYCASWDARLIDRDDEEVTI